VDEPTVLGSGDGPYGTLLLRERQTVDGLVHELVVNGVFAMDSTDTTSERQLATFARTAAPARRILVGGLGLGYTAAAVLEDDRTEVAQVDVVELEPQLVAWARAGLTPVLGQVARDDRTRMHVADVTAVLRGTTGPAGPWDAILLDVDNGPDFLIHDENAALYTTSTLQGAYDRLADGGVLAVWCQGPAPDLLEALRAVAPRPEQHRYGVRREGRRFTYVIYSLTRASAPGLR
jgi:spermidine synthase